MIVASFRCYLPVSGHDHETACCEGAPLKFLALRSSSMNAASTPYDLGRAVLE
jgi:hypothetical protein